MRTVFVQVRRGAAPRLVHRTSERRCVCCAVALCPWQCARTFHAHPPAPPTSRPPQHKDQCIIMCAGCSTVYNLSTLAVLVLCAPPSHSAAGPAPAPTPPATCGHAPPLDARPYPARLVVKRDTALVPLTHTPKGVAVDGLQSAHRPPVCLLLPASRACRTHTCMPMQGTHEHKACRMLTPFDFNDMPAPPPPHPPAHLTPKHSHTRTAHTSSAGRDASDTGPPACCVHEGWPCAALHVQHLGPF